MVIKVKKGRRILARKRKLYELGANIILVKLTDNKYTPYVTWVEDSKTGATFSGHYFTNIKDARKDFEKRAGIKKKVK